MYRYIRLAAFKYRSARSFGVSKNGFTIIQFSISKEGQLIEYEVLKHEGHESLEQSSVNAIKSSFPFKPLPVNFPDDNLTIVARLIYPNLRERAN